MPSNEQVDLPSVVFIIGKTLVNLGSRELRKAVGRHRFNRFAVLKQTNDVVNGNSGALNDGMATPNARRPDDVTIWIIYRTILQINGFQTPIGASRVSISCNVPLGSQIPNLRPEPAYNFPGSNGAKSRSRFGQAVCGVPSFQDAFSTIDWSNRRCSLAGC